MGSEQVFIGFLLIVAGLLLLDRDRRQRYEIAELKQQLAAKEERIGLLMQAQQQRVNYRALEYMEDSAAQSAVALMRLEEQRRIEEAQHKARMAKIAEAEQLVQSAVNYLGKAHNPGKEEEPA